MPIMTFLAGIVLYFVIAGIIRLLRGILGDNIVNNALGGHPRHGYFGRDNVLSLLKAVIILLLIVLAIGGLLASISLSGSP